MANGNRALQLLAPEPASSAAMVNQPVNEIDIQLGEAVAIGVTALCGAILSHHERGVFDPDVKDAVATQVAAVAMLGLDYAGDDADFIHKARRAGRARLQQYFDNDGCNIPPNVDPDVAITICMDEMLAMVTRIVTTERKYVLAMAN